MNIAAIPPATCATDGPPRSYYFTRRHGVMLVSTLELLGCLAGMIVYGYAVYVQPEWNYLVPIPQDLCNAKDIVRGVMFVFMLLCVLEFFLALFLFEGARKSNLSRIRFWLSAILTYLSLVTVVIIGMELGGIRSPTMNAAAFINIFVRFLEILVVYVYAEEESMKRNRISKRPLTASNLTVATVISSLEDNPTSAQS